MRKHSLACTLFEKDYHYGAGVLINSLIAKGFTGTVCAGYRGGLPSWVSERATTDSEGVARIGVGPVEVEFHPVRTTRNLTNFKPEFMLQMWERHAARADYVYFFDADVFVLARWSFFEEWADVGIALVADGNTPMPVNHPIRAAWRRHYEPHGFRFQRQSDLHFNGGFIGVSRDRVPLLRAWEQIQTIMEKEVSLDLPISLPGAPEWQRNRTFPFFLTDQDALNIFADLEGVTVSGMGWEGMGWRNPMVFMHHACGHLKPWRRSYLRRALRGVAPSALDRDFWNFAGQPLPVFSAEEVHKAGREMHFARALTRVGRLIGPA
jgi:hypothetical protein